MMVIVVGVLAREAILLLLPVAAGYLYDQGRLRKEWRKLLMVAIPALVVFLVLRLVLPGEGNFRIWRAPFWFYPKWFRLQTWFGLFINAFAPLIWLFIVYRRATLRFILAEKHMVLLVGLVYASTLLAHDTERLLAPAAPVIYLLVGRILQAHNQKASLWLAGMLLSLALVTAIRHLFPRTEFVQAPLLDLGLVVLPTILAVYCGIVWQRKLDFPRFTRHFLGYN